MKNISTFVIAFIIISSFFLAMPENGYSGVATPCCSVTPIPTLSEWGSIAMAGVLGIIGFMVIRRRKVTA